MEEIKNQTEEEILDDALETVEEAEVVEEKDELVEAKAKADEYLDKYQRMMAEFYNFRERTSKEKAAMYSDGVRDTVEKILPVIDNLERAIITKKEVSEETESFIKGTEMILKQFKEILSAIGVEEIKAEGEKFDPNLHSAVSHIDDENFGENTVTIEMLKGYTIKGKVIRHSMVQVAN